MSNKKVAGTIILNLNDGSKKFLMHPIGEAIEFAMAKVSDEMTGLASMLQWFKEEVQLDVTSSFSMRPVGCRPRRTQPNLGRPILGKYLSAL